MGAEPGKGRRARWRLDGRAAALYGSNVHREVRRRASDSKSAAARGRVMSLASFQHDTCAARLTVFENSICF
jgi:hypothetical protein